MKDRRHFTSLRFFHYYSVHSQLAPWEETFFPARKSILIDVDFIKWNLCKFEAHWWILLPFELESMDTNFQWSVLCDFLCPVIERYLWFSKRGEEPFLYDYHHIKYSVTTFFLTHYSLCSCRHCLYFKSLHSLCNVLGNLGFWGWCIA